MKSKIISFCNLWTSRSWQYRHLRTREFRREIQNYQLLQSLDVPVLAVQASSDRAILLEDLCRSSSYRLAVAEDAHDPQIAMRLAAWYRQLHQKGALCLSHSPNLSLYEENALITPESIERIQRVTDTAALPVWKTVERNLPRIQHLLDRTAQTLTYNDFAYKNLAVAKDRTAAFMFDYNLLGKGYAYADLRNVCSSLSVPAQQAFLNAYGAFDPTEALLDDVVSVLTTLAIACQKPSFPVWAGGALTVLHTDYPDRLDRLLQQAKKLST